MDMYQEINLGDRASVVNGTAVNVDNLKDMNVAVYGTFVGTFKLMISYDGTEFVQHGADITAVMVPTAVPRCKAIRFDCSAWTSGTAKARGAGSDVNR